MSSYLIIYSTITGFLTVIIGVIVSFVLQKLSNAKIPQECKDWNKYHVMELALFLTGIILYLVITCFL